MKTIKSENGKLTVEMDVSEVDLIRSVISEKLDFLNDESNPIDRQTFKRLDKIDFYLMFELDKLWNQTGENW